MRRQKTVKWWTSEWRESEGSTAIQAGEPSRHLVTVSWMSAGMEENLRIWESLNGKAFLCPPILFPKLWFFYFPGWVAGYRSENDSSRPFVPR